MLQARRQAILHKLANLVLSKIWCNVPGTAQAVQSKLSSPLSSAKLMTTTLSCWSDSAVAGSPDLQLYIPLSQTRSIFFQLFLTQGLSPSGRQDKIFAAKCVHNPAPKELNKINGTQRRVAAWRTKYTVLDSISRYACVGLCAVLANKHSCFIFMSKLYIIVSLARI